MANASGYWRERFSVLKMFKFNSFVAKLRAIFSRNYLIRRKANKDIYQRIY